MNENKELDQWSNALKIHTKAKIMNELRASSSQSSGIAKYSAPMVNEIGQNIKVTIVDTNS